MNRALLTQLPVPSFGWPRLDANLPLAAGYLAATARGRVPGWDVSVLPGAEADRLGDEALLAAVLAREPRVVGLSVSLWNVEASVALGRGLDRRGVRVLLGGPEVTADNGWLAAAAPFAVRVEGEGEDAFARLLPGLPPPGTLVQAPPVDLADAVSPYLTGLLAPAPDGSVWLETQRGCPFRCAYCYYGKARGRPRPFPAPWLTAHLAWAAAVGAREVYLMDPALNARRGWERVLATLETDNPGGALRFHAELVAEALRPGDAARLARAGLRTCEVGLQSTHPEVLAAVGRPWHRARWIRGVDELLDAGVAVTIGLIAGLPGDDLDRFTRTVEFALAAAPGAELQAYPLALLPGTALRARAGALGLVARRRPPYDIQETPGYRPEALREAFARFEALTGRELDALEPPALAGSWEGTWDAPYLSGAKIDVARAPRGWVDRLASRASRHLTVWIEGWTEELPCQIQALATRLPYCVLTLVLEDRPGWPPDRLASLLARGGSGDHYLDRHLAHLYGSGARLVPRLAVLVAGGGPPVSGRWLARVRQQADVVWRVAVEPGWEQGVRDRVDGGDLVLVEGCPEAASLEAVARALQGEAAGVIFADPEAHAGWESARGSAGPRGREYRVSVP